MRCERCGIDHHDTPENELVPARDGRRVCRNCEKVIERQSTPSSTLDLGS
ncbi:MAG: hypothetical protein ACR2O0_10900 [Rhizobiaceae bacterium]